MARWISRSAREDVRDDDAVREGRDAELVPSCTYPLTGVACVSRVYTDHAVFVLDGGDVDVRETHGISRDELRERLGLS